MVKKSMQKLVGEGIHGETTTKLKREITREGNNKKVVTRAP